MIRNTGYKKPLKKCHRILKGVKNVNYVLCVCDSDDASKLRSYGGLAWNINEDEHENIQQPDFSTMVGNLINSYLDSNGYSYTGKLTFIRNLSSELIDNITEGKKG